MTERKPGPHYIIERIVKWERERYCCVIEAETQRVVIEAPWSELYDRMDELAAGQQNVTVEFKPLEPEGWEKSASLEMGSDDPSPAQRRPYRS